MARTWQNFLVLPYTGGIAGQAIDACRKSIYQPQVIGVSIYWPTYGVQFGIGPTATTFNGGVSIDLKARTTSAALDIVKSVYIDNTNNPRPVYLVCADTGHTVACQQFSSIQAPLISDAQLYTLFTDNMVPMIASKCTTTLYFSNAPFDSFLASEFNSVSPLYQISGYNNFGYQILPDKIWGGTPNPLTTPVNNDLVICSVNMSASMINGGQNSAGLQVVSADQGTKQIAYFNQAIASAANLTVANIQGAQMRFKGPCTMTIQGNMAIGCSVGYTLVQTTIL